MYFFMIFYALMHIFNVALFGEGFWDIYYMSHLEEALCKAFEIKKLGCKHLFTIEAF